MKHELWRRASRLLAIVGLVALSVGATAVAAGADNGGVPDPNPSSGDVHAASDIASFRTVFNTDVAYAGLGGVRGGGSGSVNLSGVSGTVTKAYLYWQGPTNSSDPAANANVSFGGTGISGTNIGFSSDNCWSFQNSQAYRADVTSLVSGNGSYAVANFVNASADINGIELVVFFQDGNPSNNKDVVIYDGNDSNTTNNFDAPGWNVALTGINYASGSASLEMIVGDGQVFPDGALVLNGTDLAPAGSVFDGNTVPDAGSAGATNGGLWDQRNFDVTSYLTPGPNTLTLTSSLASDCLSLVVTAIELPAGAAPGQPASITVDKTVLGSAPAGSVFTVDAVCTPVTGAEPTTVTATFDSTGAPVGSNVLEVPQGSTCVVSEAAPPGPPISVSYACTPAGSDPTVCATDPASATVVVDGNVSGSVATVTVTNSYEVVVSPRFTG